MIEAEVDVLIVGAGPAGSSAALAASRCGARVLMVERRATVGSPVQCAEYIPAMLVGELALGNGYVVQKVIGMRTFVSGQPLKETNAPGFIIRRDRFDQTIAEAAVKAGTELRCGTRAIGISPDGEVRLRTKTEAVYGVRAQVIVGADGPHSSVGRWVGAVDRRLLPGVQMTMTLAAALNHTEVYFEPEIVAGYGWLFPKGTVANVGLGMLRPASSASRLREILERFVRRLVDAGKIRGSAVGHAAGWIPVKPLERAVYGNILLVGDAAGQTHPITGAGIFSAVTCGKMAGECAARAAAAGDRALLRAYDVQWRDLLGHSLVRAAERRSQMESGWSDYPAIVRRCWVAFREYYV